MSQVVPTAKTPFRACTAPQPRTPAWDLRTPPSFSTLLPTIREDPVTEDGTEDEGHGLGPLKTGH